MDTINDIDAVYNRITWPGARTEYMCLFSII